jgi:hypothetical protein
MFIRKSVAALALTAGAALGGLAAAGPAAATPQNGLVNVYTQDILSGNQVVVLQNVPVSVAAIACGLTADVLSNDLLSGNQTVCVNKNTSLIKSWVSYA